MPYTSRWIENSAALVLHSIIWLLGERCPLQCQLTSNTCFYITWLGPSRFTKADLHVLIVLYSHAIRLHLADNVTKTHHGHYHWLCHRLPTSPCSLSTWPVYRSGLSSRLRNVGQLTGNGLLLHPLPDVILSRDVGWLCHSTHMLKWPCNTTYDWSMTWGIWSIGKAHSKLSNDTSFVKVLWQPICELLEESRAWVFAAEKLLNRQKKIDIWQRCQSSFNLFRLIAKDLLFLSSPFTFLII